MKLALHRIPGEAKGELVMFQSWGTFTFWVKHEYPAAPWEWILIEEGRPVVFGDAPDQETAEQHLMEAVRQYCPDFEAPSPKPPLLVRLWRAL